jgi:outer membrane receptor protein involved in Fe transport
VQEDFFCEADYHIQSYRVDLTLPGPLLTLDAGLNYTDIRNQAWPKLGKDIAYAIYIGERHMFYDFQEKTKAAYISLHKDWKRLSIKAGLRYEHIGLDGKTEYRSIYDPNQIGTTYFGQFPSRNYWQPSLSASFRPQEGHQLSLVWGTSCIRPNFYDLTPLYNYKSGYEVSEGNPNICPSRVSSVELSYHNHQGLYACAYYHHASDVLTRMTTLSAYYRTNEGITTFNGVRTTPQNYGKVNQYGLYLRYQYPLTKDLQTIAEGEAYYNDQKTDSWYNEQIFSGKGQRLALSVDWYMNRQRNLLLNARYQHCFSDYVALVKTENYGYFTFALRYSLMDDRLKLALVVKDPFHQHVTNDAIWSNMSSYSDKGFVIRQLSQYPFYSRTLHHSHYIGFTATYAFGGRKEYHIHHDIDNTESKRAEKQKTNN